ncbi:hypothetical protein F5877DRAFT_85902 [Lentinula edodes]|nr:hypothetical protein F5877DRAFT_85902 [Lentinula edodes]
MPSSRAARSSRSASRSSTSRGRQRSASIHTSWGPLLNGNIMPWREEDRIEGKTLGLFFRRDDAIPEQKHFDSIISREDNNQFIEVQRAFKFDYYADFYQTKVIVGSRKYYVAGTFNRESGEVNTSLESYGYNKDFAGDVAIFFHSKYNPERFLDYLPRYTNANEREIAIRRVIAAFCKNIKDHVEKGTALKPVVRG